MTENKCPTNDQRLPGFDTCTGCGTCYAICPAEAIELKMDPHRGVFHPSVDNYRCCDCGICSGICPGLSLDIDSIASSVLDSGSTNASIGHFVACYIAHSTDYEIRYRSTSGGLVATLLITALEEGLIDGALVTRMSDDNPLIAEPFIARTKKDILSASGSKYCPVPANKAIRELLNGEGKFAVVGLPCHLHGIRKAELANEDLRRKIALHLGLFCSHTLNYHSVNYLLSRIGVNPNNVERIDYRGGGWPGELTIRERCGNEHIIPIRSPLWGGIFGSHFFTPTPCLWCTDLTSELSDLSFGDPWLPEFLNSEKVGKSIVISRTRLGEELLRMVRNRCNIELERIDANVVTASQAQYCYFKKENSGVRQRIGRRDFIIPDDTTERCESIIGILVAVNTILISSMGRNRALRRVLECIPLRLLYWYSTALNRIIAVDIRGVTLWRGWRR